MWNPLAGVEYTGRIRVDLPARYGGAIVLFIGDAMPLVIDAETIDGDAVLIQRERLRAGLGLQIPPDFWLDDNNPWNAPAHIIRASVDAYPDRDLSLVMSLGRRAPRVLARLIGYPAEVRVPVCSVPVGEDETLFATGWYGQEPVGASHGRWMENAGAVLVSSSRGGAVTVRVRATAAATTSDDPTRLTLRVNDVFEPPALAMREGVAEYEWNVPDPAWVTGTNELLFSVSRTVRRNARTLGMSLQDLLLIDRE